MELDADDMRLGSLEMRIIAEGSSTNPRQELVLEITYTEISLFEKRKRGYTEHFTASLSSGSIAAAIELAKKILKSEVTSITAGAMFRRKYIGSTDDDFLVALENFYFDSNSDILTSLIKIEATDSLTWEPDPEFKLSAKEFWSIWLVSFLAVNHIEEISSKLGFATDVKSKELKITALRNV
jgi:hypothetical protein